jgi:hypothetical protein
MNLNLIFSRELVAIVHFFHPMISVGQFTISFHKIQLNYFPKEKQLFDCVSHLKTVQSNNHLVTLDKIQSLFTNTFPLLKNVNQNNMTRNYFLVNLSLKWKSLRLLKPSKSFNQRKLTKKDSKK